MQFRPGHRSHTQVTHAFSVASLLSNPGVDRTWNASTRVLVWQAWKELASFGNENNWYAFQFLYLIWFAFLLIYLSNHKNFLPVFCHFLICFTHFFFSMNYSFHVFLLFLLFVPQVSFLWCRKYFFSPQTHKCNFHHIEPVLSFPCPSTPVLVILIHNVVFENAQLFSNISRKVFESAS